MCSVALGRQEEHTFKAKLGYILRVPGPLNYLEKICLKKRKGGGGEATAKMFKDRKCSQRLQRKGNFVPWWEKVNENKKSPWDKQLNLL